MKSSLQQHNSRPAVHCPVGHRTALGFCFSLLAAVACGGGESSESPGGAGATNDGASAGTTDGVPNMQLTRLANDVSEGLYVAQPPGEDRALYVVEQGGRIRILGDDGFAPVPFLDIEDRTLSDGERGLLGLAFHPQFEENGLFYVHYSARGGALPDTPAGSGVVAEYTVSSANPGVADVATERILLTLAQPDVRLNGGCLQFGPDGMLYIGTGDGGLRGDPLGNSQSLSSLLGKILRIDVNGRDVGGAYGIPPGNMASPALPEIWSYGLRNPWRFSFDRQEGHLYVGDLGEVRLEEVNFQPQGTSGYNFGWNTQEGEECYSPPPAADENGMPIEDCRLRSTQFGLQIPIATYGRDGNLGGFAITGGYVYRGSAIPGLVGKYVYTDFISGNFWALDVANAPTFPSPELITAAIPAPDGATVGEALYTSFGEDNAGELYLVSFDGSLYRLDPRP